MKRLNDVKTEVCDTAGFYDEFQVKDVMRWLPYGQVTRDAIRELVREGLLVRASRGVYRWFVG